MMTKKLEEPMRLGPEYKGKAVGAELVFDWMAYADDIAQRLNSAEFWKGVYPTGWDAERIAAEMHDYMMVLDGLGALYCHITGGKCSKENTDKAVVRQLHDDHVTELVEEHLKDMMTGADYEAASQPCGGCGKPLILINAWMEDGCHCNSPAGVNNTNLWRWNLLHKLQQRMSSELNLFEKRRELKRMWINQPEKDQLLHKLNGTRVLAREASAVAMRIYFISGPVVSMDVPRRSLSDGWPTYVEPVR